MLGAFEDQDYVEAEPEECFINDKLPNPTAFTTNRHTISNFSPNNNYEQDSLVEPMELSFEAEIYQETVALIKQGLVTYISHTLEVTPQLQESIFVDGAVFNPGAL